MNEYTASRYIRKLRESLNILFPAIGDPDSRSLGYATIYEGSILNGKADYQITLQRDNGTFSVMLKFIVIDNLEYNHSFPISPYWKVLSEIEILVAERKLLSINYNYHGASYFENKRKFMFKIHTNPFSKLRIDDSLIKIHDVYLMITKYYVLTLP